MHKLSVRGYFTFFKYNIRSSGFDNHGFYFNMKQICIQKYNSAILQLHYYFKTII